MKIVSDQPGIFSTIQGGGIWVGEPMTFIRTHGCDYNCPWCDTKYAREGGFVDISVDDILEKVSDFGNDKVVITGGNPLLQNDDLEDLVTELAKDSSKKIMVATQASFSVPNLYNILRHIHLLALGPKLHNWKWSALRSIVYAAVNYRRDIQLDVVCQSEGYVELALNFMEILHNELKGYPYIHYFIVPEYSVGAPLIEGCIRVIKEWVQEGHRPVPRLMPQMHKLVYNVP